MVMVEGMVTETYCRNISQSLPIRGRGLGVLEMQVVETKVIIYLFYFFTA